MRQASGRNHPSVLLHVHQHSLPAQFPMGSTSIHTVSKTHFIFSTYLPLTTEICFSCQWVTPTIPEVKEREQLAARDVNQRD